jgi:hypothetical protein
VTAIQEDKSDRAGIYKYARGEHPDRFCEQEIDHYRQSGL